MLVVPPAIDLSGQESPPGASAVSVPSDQGAASPTDADHLGRDLYLQSVLRLLQLAVEGVPGLLHSTRSLRNIALQHTNGDQDAAGLHVVERTGSGVIGDSEQIVNACVLGTGLPLAIAVPMWHRLRRVGLLCELLGHDARQNRGRVLCASCGVPTTSEPIDTAAAHTIWFTLCHRAIRTSVPLLEFVESFENTHGQSADATLRTFAKGRQAVVRSEWRKPVDGISLVRAKLIASELLADADRASRAAARAGVTQPAVPLAQQVDLVV
mmetsp:Transcript_10951/g.18370  ORF Transcript_10951/g.18370 Transcript_10951/m.18370 type:complete len:268 (+) Transcript_10951:21-824(+)